MIVFPSNSFESAQIRCLSSILIGLLISVSFLGTLRAKSYSDVGNGYIADHWNVDDGLPGNQIRSIAQSTDGYIWIGTYYGLARFDGQEFTVFDANTPGLPPGAVINIIPGPNGSLWLNVRQKVIHYNDGYFQPSTIVAPNPETIISLHALRPDGTLVYSQFNRETRRRRLMSMKDQGRTEHTTRGPDRGKRPRFSAATDQQGTTWWIHRNELGVLTETGVSIRHLFNDNESITAGPTPAELGGVWLAVDGKLMRYHEDRFIHNDIRQPELGQTNADRVLETKNDSVWVKRFGTRHYDHFVHSGKSGYVLENTIMDIGGLPLIDAEGKLWLANRVEFKGLSRIRKRKFNPLSELHPGTENVRSFLQQSTGELLLGSSNGILKIAANQIYESSSTQAIKLGRGAVWTLTANRMGEVTGGKYASGQKKPSQSLPSKSTFSLKGEAFIPIDAFVAGSGRRIVATCYDLENRLWVGSSDGGLAMLEDNRSIDLSGYENFPKTEVLSLACSLDGTVWIGTGDDGIYRYRDDQFEHISKESGLDNLRVRVIGIGQSGDIWFGTGGHGIYRYRDGSFYQYAAEQGLPSNEISTLIDDQLGSLWFGSYNGIHRVSFENFDRVAMGEITHLFANSYSMEDGLPSLQCKAGHPSSLRTNDGNLWFSTSGGPCYVNPKTLPLNKTPPKVLLSTLYLDGNPILVPQHKNNPTFSIPSHIDRIEIRFTGINFSAPDEIRFRYRLKEITSDWTDIGTQRSIVFQDLAPGHYRLQVSAANNSGVWNEKGTEMTIKVKGPIWKSAGAQAIGGLILIGLISIGFLTRIARDKRRKAEQDRFTHDIIQNQETDRKRIAQELHDSLEQNLLVIKNRAALTLSSPSKRDNMATALEEISDISLDSIQEVRNIANNLRPYQIDRLGLSKAIQSMLNKIADSSEMTISHEIDSIPTGLSPELQINLYRIIQEVLNNAIKHAHATQIIVTLLASDQILTLRIKDNGNGFDPDSTHENQESGLGLSGIRERSTMFKGTHQLIASKGNGTEWIIRFPITKQA